MKYITILTVLLSIIALPAHSDLTPTDLDNIQEIVKKAVTESEKRTKDYVDIRFDNVDQRFDNVDKRMTQQANFTYGLMALIAIAIGFPAWRSQKDRSIEKQMEALQQEIEILKKQRIQSP